MGRPGRASPQLCPQASPEPQSADHRPFSGIPQQCEFQRAGLTQKEQFSRISEAHGCWGWREHRPTQMWGIQISFSAHPLPSAGYNPTGDPSLQWLRCRRHIRQHHRGCGRWRPEGLAPLKQRQGTNSAVSAEDQSGLVQDTGTRTCT